MAPPFIAYYGALAGGAVGADLLQQAYDQCRLYRNYLRDPIGLWRHITLGDGTDETHWGTGKSMKLDVTVTKLISMQVMHGLQQG